jgi:hypothetical protein
LQNFSTKYKPNSTSHLKKAKDHYDQVGFREAEGLEASTILTYWESGKTVDTKF